MKGCVKMNGNGMENFFVADGAGARSVISASSHWDAAIKYCDKLNITSIKTITVSFCKNIYFKKEYIVKPKKTYSIVELDNNSIAKELYEFLIKIGYPEKIAEKKVRKEIVNNSRKAQNGREF